MLGIPDKNGRDTDYKDAAPLIGKRIPLWWTCLRADGLVSAESPHKRRFIKTNPQYQHIDN